MKCLVTGASGLLGFETCRLLKSAGHEVWAVDNGFRSTVVPPNDHYFQTDLSNILNQLPTDFDMIYHLAAINGTDYFYSIPLKVLTNNLDCDLKIFEWAEKCHRLKKLVYASSSEVVAGSIEHGIPEKIDIEIKNIHNPRWSYRLAKIVAENYLHNSGLPWIAVRYFNVYGSQSKSGHFVADQIDNQRQGVFRVIGGDETRSFCHVTDAMSATIRIADVVEREIINVGSDEEIQIFHGAKIISQCLGVKDPVWTSLPGRPGSSIKRVPDISKLRNICPDYTPRPFAQGIAEIIKDYDNS